MTFSRYGAACLAAVVACGAWLCAEPASSPMMERWKRDDRNHDGRVSRAEFSGGDRLFNLLDANHDGAITRQEMETFIRRRARSGGRSPSGKYLPNELGENVKTYRDLEYARAGQTKLRADLYVPGNLAGKPPLVVWIHGGGWRAGSKQNCPVRWLTGHGYAVASIDYRLTPTAAMPAQIHDCKAAVRWLRAHAGEHGYDARAIVVAGSSAGGHLAALLGTSGGVAELEGDLGCPDQSSRVQGVIDLFGPTDIFTMPDYPSRIRRVGNDYPEAKLVGGDVKQHIDAARRASPITYVTPDDPPFLIFHGDQDQVVPTPQSRTFVAALKKAGVAVEYHELKGSGHGGPEFLNTAENRKLILQFLRKHLPAPPNAKVKERNE